LPTIYHRELGMLFVHIPKCAGSTVTRFLIGKGLITDEEVGIDGLDPASRTALMDGWVMAAMPDHELAPHIERNNRWTRYRLLHARHARAADIRGLLGAQAFGDLDSFALVRDPFTRLESMYHYIRKNAENPLNALATKLSFEDFVWWHCAATPSPQVKWLTDETGAVIVNHIVRAENLDAYLTDLGRRKFGRADPIRVVNASANHEMTPYRNYAGLMPATIDLIRQTYADDFRLLGYDAGAIPEAIQAVPIAFDTLARIAADHQRDPDSIVATCAAEGVSALDAVRQLAFRSSRSLLDELNRDRAVLEARAATMKAMADRRDELLAGMTTRRQSAGG